MVPREFPDTIEVREERLTVKQSLEWLMTANGRRWIYGVAAAAIVTLGVYNVVNTTQAAAWMSLVLSLVGLGAPATALRHITPDEPATGGDPGSDYDEGMAG